MFNRIILNIKHRSNATLRAWTYQCESILAQRSRRIQQLCTFYHRVYGPHGLRQLLHAYHSQFQPPLRRMMLSAVGVVGLGVSNTVSAASPFNWTMERLSLVNFDMCNRDIEFIETLQDNKLCPMCKAKNMKYCYCLLGNKKCKSHTGEETIRGCRKPMNLDVELGSIQGSRMIEAADENAWEPYFSRDEFTIWRREERTSMYSYKVYARFDDITAQDLLYVQTDLAYRRQWDETAVALELIEEDPLPGTNSDLIYWELQWPRMFSNRDYVYTRRFVADEKRKCLMICNKGSKHPKYPENSRKVRVNDYWSMMVIKPYRAFEEPGAHYILTYYDDPSVPIPQSVKSWVTQKQMPDFLQKMYLATKRYKCRDAMCMKKVHNLDNFNIMDDEYTANTSRSSWLWRLWRQRDSGK